ncbi:MAG: hypothetical protein OSB00_07575 [Sphingomonas bacterium]|nr:hypothetical protein [Sphingomonas bacterium]
MTRDQEKAERLAAALRANLRRRKSQARASDAENAAASPPDSSAGSAGDETAPDTDSDSGSLIGDR